MAQVAGIHFNMSGSREPENISGLAVSTNFLSMMGVRPLVGRDFTPEEEKPGTPPVLLLSHSLWRSHFGADLAALGRTIRLDSRAYTIIGVLPPEFRWTENCDVIEPAGVWATDNSGTTSRGERGEMVVVGRLAEGRNLQQARTELTGIAARLEREYPETNSQFGVRLQSLREAFSGDARPSMLLLLGAAMFVLLVACANVANLFLMRGAVRTRELALRIAIGASRGRIIRQMLTESFLVALLGGAAGVGLAMVGIPSLVQLIPPETVSGAKVELNGAVLLFSLGLVVLSVIVFGVAPALTSTNGAVHSDLKEGGKSTGTSRHNRWRGLLAASEIAFALILLVGAGLMMKSLYRLLSVDSGFRREGVVKLELSLRTERYEKRPAVAAFWQQTLDRVSGLPGVESAALGTAVPLTQDHWRTDITIEGMPLPKLGDLPHPDVHIVSPDYVRTLGIRMLRGRGFLDQDGEKAPPVALVNARVAESLFAGMDPLGKRFAFGRPSPGKTTSWVTIVGVVADTRLYGLANPSRLEVYVPLRQKPSDSMTLLVKTRSDPTALVAPIRAAIASIDKDQPVFGVATMQEVVNASLSTNRVTLILVGLFSGLALVLASIGIYGVVSYSVAQRSKEIGIRLALGAERTSVLRLVFAQGGRIAASGILAGSVASLLLTRLMTKLLFGVSAVDPGTFTAVALVLGGVTIAACYVPARRAMNVDPLIALRHE
ncbi:MAG: ABC transporter permease [Paludibaculum sp.]